MAGDAPTRYRTRREVVRRTIGDRLWVVVADRDDDPLELAGAAAVLVTDAERPTTIAAVVARFVLAPGEADAAAAALATTAEHLCALGVLEPSDEHAPDPEPDPSGGLA